MKLSKSLSVILLSFSMAIAIACSNKNQSLDVTNDIRHALDQAGLNDVKVGVSQLDGPEPAPRNAVGAGIEA